MKPLFTVVIPTLNEERYLAYILGDLLAQQIKNFEVIIVDADSDDRTKEIAKQFSSKLPLRFIEVKKRNVSFQRNTGCRKAKGKYVIFIDADARVFRAFTKKLENHITHSTGLVFIPAIVPSELNSQTKVIFNFANFIVEMSQGIGRPFSSGGSMIFERGFFLLIGGFPENVYMSEDHQIIQKAFKYGVRARFMRDVKVKMSLRRLKKEGELKLYYKYLLTAAQYLIKGKVDRKVIDYQMGGHFYIQKNHQTIEERVREYITEAQQFFKTIFLN